MRRLTTHVPPEHRFRINRILLDSAGGDTYMKMRSAYGQYRVQADTALAIDGFPRSANTYALFAAEDTLGRGPVKGHTHSAATLKRAVLLNVPALLLVREPRAVVSSLVQMASGVTPETAFAAYTRFHRRLLDVRDDLYVAQFSEVVDNFGAVMMAVNERFKTDLPVFEKNEESEARIRRRVDEANSSLNGGTLREQGVARPSGHRRPATETLANMSPLAHRRCDEAESVYRDILKDE